MSVPKVVKRPRVLLDIEEHASFIFGENMEAGLRFPEAVFRKLATRRLSASSRCPESEASDGSSHRSYQGSAGGPWRGFQTTSSSILSGKTESRSSGCFTERESWKAFFGMKCERVPILRGST